MTINELMEQAYATAKEKGWWDEGQQREIGTQIALIHSELSEALEEYRRGGVDALTRIYYLAPVMIKDNAKPEGFPIELADLLIRVADTCAHYKIDLTEALETKLAYNKTRPFRHGGKVC